MRQLWTGRRLFAALLSLGITLSFTGCGGGNNTTGLDSQAVLITVQPLSQTTPVGQTATFTVAATGTSLLTYQWSENGAKIAGATGTSYTTPDVALGAGGSTTVGSFQVVVSNGVNSVMSNAATLTAGPRSPKAGDLRYLLWQQADAPGLFSTGGGSGEVEVSPSGIIDTTASQALGSPLGMGSSFACGDGACTWSYIFQPLPTATSALNMYYKGGIYSNFTSDLQSYAAANIVFTSMDFEPAENAYAVSWVQTTQPSGFDYRLDPVVPAGTEQQTQIQAQATLDGTESRIVTAVSLDASGNATLISYGWTGDTTTVYETQTIAVPPSTSISPAVVSAATTLANAGYFISAFGGNDTDGYILIGARVKGDTLTRSITQASTATQPPYQTPVVYLKELGVDTIITEK
ncbi:immunoglobulin domain-containing protein [Granulicella mallensis]|uniref:Ig-like domain-containing protein n=1 Tax=Granulicella mallensis TaxID=940614 RepID=A0A7W7ZN69_9BACT|nr:immunoglobulin domain-containing protein [Granulicella mallensis]MBB5063030.1 hypothetical protein [Granulicella mallensis]